MAPKVLCEIEAEYVEAAGLLSWGDKLVLQCVNYDQLCLARRVGAAVVSNNLLAAARLKRDLERRKAAVEKYRQPQTQSGR